MFAMNVKLEMLLSLVHFNFCHYTHIILSITSKMFQVVMVLMMRKVTLGRVTTQIHPLNCGSVMPARQECNQ